MNKSELVSLMSELNDTSKAEAERSLNMAVEGIIGALGKGHDVNLVGFGSFVIRKREARDGRNPKTGEQMRIAAYNQPVFRAGKAMKEACN